MWPSQGSSRHGAGYAPAQPGLIMVTLDTLTGVTATTTADFGGAADILFAAGAVTVDADLSDRAAADAGENRGPNARGWFRLSERISFPNELAL